MGESSNLELAGNLGDGIVMSDSSQNQVSGNTVDSNRVGVHWTRRSRRQRILLVARANEQAGRVEVGAL